MSPREPLHSWVAGRVIEAFFAGGAAAGGVLPPAQPGFHGVERFSNIPYRRSGHRAHLLDIYRPRDLKGPAPVVFYTHGGGFRFMSKESHWVMALGFARRGYIVVVINYRLAPRHPFPAALVDSCHALEWTYHNIEAYGGNPEEILFAGESAGANLAANLTLASTVWYEEAWMQRVHRLNVTPRAAIFACGILQVSDPERYLRRKDPLPAWLFHRVEEVGRDYMCDSSFLRRRTARLADPVVELESMSRLPEHFPPVFAPVGTRDPLLDDTRRLEAALFRLGGRIVARYYPDEQHVFHAFLWRSRARQCWMDTYAFLDRHIPITPRTS
jgi:acetyl esterase